MGADPLAGSQAGLNRGASLRVFVGIALPNGHVTSLGGYLDACREVAPDFRWVPAETLHLTLRFVGNVDAGAVDRLRAELRSVSVDPLEVSIDGLGSFGRGGVAQVIWLGLAGEVDSLLRLAAVVEQGCVRSGLRAEQRPYNPHLTLARARERRGSLVPALPEPPSLPPFAVKRFRLYASRTGPAGAVYSVLEEFG